jgi:hypothetical protein
MPATVRPDFLRLAELLNQYEGYPGTQAGLIRDERDWAVAAGVHTGYIAILDSALAQVGTSGRFIAGYLFPHDDFTLLRADDA